MTGGRIRRYLVFLFYSLIVLLTLMSSSASAVWSGNPVEVGTFPGVGQAPTYPGSSSQSILYNDTIYAGFFGGINSSHGGLYFYKSSDFGEHWDYINSFNRSIEEVTYLSFFATPSEILAAAWGRQGLGYGQSTDGQLDLYSYNWTDGDFELRQSAVTGDDFYHFAIHTNTSGYGLGCMIHGNSGNVSIYKYNISSGNLEFFYDFGEIVGVGESLVFSQCDITQMEGDWHMVYALNNGTLVYANTSNLGDWTTENLSVDVYEDTSIFHNQEEQYLSLDSASAQIQLMYHDDEDVISYGKKSTISGWAYITDIFSGHTCDLIGQEDRYSMATYSVSSRVYSIFTGRGPYNHRLCFFNTSTSGTLWQNEYLYHEGGPTDSNYIMGNIQEMRDPLDGSYASNLMFFFYDDDMNKVYYDSRALAYVPPIAPTGSFVGENTSSSNLTVQSRYIHENRINGTLYINWSVDGINSSTSTSVISGQLVNFTLGESNFSKGDNVSIILYSVDTQGSVSPSNNGLSIIIQNSAPTASSINMSPSAPVDSDDVTCTYLYSDPDSDGESNSLFKWYLNGVVTSFNESILPAENTSSGEIWICSVAPADGIGVGVYYNSSATPILADPVRGGDTSGGGGGVTKVRTLTPLSSNISSYCGDNICNDEEGENPANCYSDCKVNTDTLFLCIFKDEIECNWEQTWFPSFLVAFLAVIFGIAMYRSSQNRK